jgi:hypothetical protein
VDRLLQEPRNSSSLDGYSLLSLDAWIMTTDDVVAMVETLQQRAPDGFRFVLPSQFVKLVTDVLRTERQQSRPYP